MTPRASTIARYRVLLLAMVVSPGCTPGEAAPWGKAMLAFMLVALVAIPVAFGVAWRRRLRSDREAMRRPGRAG